MGDSLSYYDFCKNLVLDYVGLLDSKRYTDYKQVANDFISLSQVEDELEFSGSYIHLLQSWSSDLTLYSDYRNNQGSFMYNMYDETNELFHDFVLNGVTQIFESSDVLHEAFLDYGSFSLGSKLAEFREELRNSTRSRLHLYYN